MKEEKERGDSGRREGRIKKRRKNEEEKGRRGNNE